MERFGSAHKGNLEVGILLSQVFGSAHMLQLKSVPGFQILEDLESAHMLDRERMKAQGRSADRTPYEIVPGFGGLGCLASRTLLALWTLPWSRRAKATL